MYINWELEAYVENIVCLICSDLSNASLKNWETIVFCWLGG